MNTALNEYWQGFLMENNLCPNTPYLESFYFGNNETIATEIIKLVLSGKKVATSSTVYQFMIFGRKLPEVGDYSIVTDYYGNPHCIIQTTNMEIIKFKHVTYEMCKKEGENRSLEAWQQQHIEYFNEVGEDIGFQFSWDMDLVYEEFRVVYKH